MKTNFTLIVSFISISSFFIGCIPNNDCPKFDEWKCEKNNETHQVYARTLQGKYPEGLLYPGSTSKENFDHIDSITLEKHNYIKGDFDFSSCKKNIPRTSCIDVPYVCGLPVN